MNAHEWMTTFVTTFRLIEGGLALIGARSILRWFDGPRAEPVYEMPVKSAHAVPRYCGRIVDDPHQWGEWQSFHIEAEVIEDDEVEEDEPVQRPVIVNQSRRRAS